MNIQEKERILLSLKDEIVTSEEGTFEYQPPQPPLPEIISITKDDIQQLLNDKSVQISNIDIAISEENQKILLSQSQIGNLKLTQDEIRQVKSQLNEYLNLLLAKE